MNCHACGHRQTDGAAAYCGNCGVPLTCSPASTGGEVADKPATTLSAALEQLADLLDQQPFTPSRAGLTLRALADAAPADSDKPTVVVMGEYRRGKSTVVNRLVGQEVVSVAVGREEQAVRIRFGPSVSAARPSPDVYCEAEILRGIDLIDTPGAVRTEGKDIGRATRHALTAAAIVFCVDARQPLSAAERELLVEELLPLTACPLLLAVTFVDQVPQEEDQEEIESLVRRFIDRIAEHRVEFIMLTPGRKPDQPVDDLAAWIKVHAVRPAPAAADRDQRLEELLSLIERSIPAAGSPASDGNEQRDAALVVLDREHRLALVQAAALLRQECSHLRTQITSILEALPQESHGREGVGHVVRNLRTIVERCGAKYLAALQDGLRTDGPPALKATAPTIDADAQLDVPSPKRPAPTAADARRDWRSAGLAATALAVATTSINWIPLLGAGITLVAVNSWRAGQRRRQEAESRSATANLLQDWLTEVEPDVVVQLNAAAEKVLEDIRQLVVQRFEDAEVMSPRPGDDLRQAIVRCRQLLAGGEP